MIGQQWAQIAALLPPETQAEIVWAILRVMSFDVRQHVLNVAVDEIVRSAAE